MYNSKHLQDLPQYHFDRDEFCKAFYKVFTKDEMIDILSMNLAPKDEFVMVKNGDEYYIIHLASATVINWYKHLGRTNTCNKSGFTIDDLNEFLIHFKEDIFD